MAWIKRRTQKPPKACRRASKALRRVKKRAETLPLKYGRWFLCDIFRDEAWARKFLGEPKYYERPILSRDRGAAERAAPGYAVFLFQVEKHYSLLERMISRHKSSFVQGRMPKDLSRAKRFYRKAAVKKFFEKYGIDSSFLVAGTAAGAVIQIPGKLLFGHFRPEIFAISIGLGAAMGGLVGHKVIRKAKKSTEKSTVPITEAGVKSQSEIKKDIARYATFHTALLFEEGLRLAKKQKIPLNRAFEIILKEVERQREKTEKLMSKIYYDYNIEFIDSMSTRKE